MKIPLVTRLALLALIVALWSPICAADPLFSAVPLTDFGPDETYLGVFPGKLYEESNTLPPGSQHDLDGQSFAAHVVPRDSSGSPDPVNGKIVVVGIGMSNWTWELCSPTQVTDTPPLPCTPASFLKNALADPAINNTSLVFIDCAAISQVAPFWVDDSMGLYSRCNTILADNKVTAQQVQVILWKDADAFPTVSLAATSDCSTSSSIGPSTPDACAYEHVVAVVARFVKTEYPNVQQMFLHSRIYAGYAQTPLSPEPYAYEYGFATKWLIQAQIDQISSGTINLGTGDLSYGVAPWLAWGPYFWADGPQPRSDGLTWLRQDVGKDGIHPTKRGVKKVTQMMLPFYKSSPYSPWFVADTSKGVPLDLSATTLDFKSEKVGHISSVKDVKVKNPKGNAAPAVFNGLSIAQAAGNFVIDRQTTTCEVGANLDPGKSCKIALQFTPAAVGSQSATLSINDWSSSALTVQLTGTGK